MEYTFKDIYESFSISYFTKDELLLVNGIVDIDKLEEYEAIEKSTKDINSILIKKFKFRVSAFESNNFSEEIVISDDYKFDLSILSHTDSLIKIAIVKDDFDNWLSSNALNNYDFIFTTDEEFKDSLKNDFDIFFIDEENIYIQFKMILNLLYARKKEKFYYFITQKFNYVFPKWKNYFKVLNSPYFDEEWYRDTYGLQDNTDPVIHFLLIGSDKRYDPGPNFSTSEYYECNMDVEVKGVNALIHYELYGKKENRIHNVSDIPQRNYSLISNSPLFDKEWYEKIYDIPSDVDCVEHYLNTGYKMRYNPGPNFDTHEYYEINGDVKRTGINPLLHYELYGRKENRKIYFSDEENESQYSLISNSPYFNKTWYEQTYDIPSDMDPVYHYLKIGFAKRYNPSSKFNTSEYYECHKDVEEHGMNALLHYERYGREEGRIIHLSEKK